MNEFTIVTTIGRPVGEVFAIIRDVARTPVWTPGMTEARQTSEGPLEPGATLVYRGTFLGRSYENARGLHGPGREQAVRHPEHRRAALHRDRHHGGASGGRHPG
jgi:hypothetical protein